MNTLLFLNLGAGEIVLIALVVLLLFGGKKIPELMKGLGKGVRNFKDGLKIRLIQMQQTLILIKNSLCEDFSFSESRHRVNILLAFLYPFYFCLSDS